MGTKPAQKCPPTIDCGAVAEKAISSIAVGGAGLAAECMRRGLIDEFELFVVPIVVGGGTPYFPPDVHVDLELVETRTFGATVYLHYRRRG